MKTVNVLFPLFSRREEWERKEPTPCRFAELPVIL